MGAQASKANLELPFYDRHPAQEVNDVQTLVQDETLDDNITKCTRPKLKKQLSIELKVDLMCEDEELSTEWDIIRADYEGNDNFNGYRFCTAFGGQFDLRTIIIGDKRFYS